LIKAEKADDVLSVSDIKLRIDSLSEAEWMKLGKSAEILCWGLAIEGQDLLNIAICKILEGKRKCPSDLPVIVTLYGVMKSLVSAYIKKRKRDPLAQSAEITSEDGLLEDVDLKPNVDTPEEILIANQTIKQIEQALSGDETIEMVFMAQMDGYSPNEIQDLVGLSAVQYASTLRAIRRKLDKLDIERSGI
jgi:DNA-directed RNA polymerase specialized sigma24 family protein